MNLPTKLTAAVAFTLLVASALPASAFPHKKVDQDSPFSRKLTPTQDQLVNKAIAREAIIIKTLRERSPIVETYIQNMRPDPVMGQTVDSDAHYLARVDFGKVIGLVRGLGHGLDDPALASARGIRFRPALNAAAEPVDFPTNIIIHFVINN